MKKNISKFDIIIQARIGSTRLPGKILKTYKNLTPLKILIKRLQNCKNIKNIIICTTKDPNDFKVVNFCKKEKLLYFRGNKQNVLSRYYNAAKKFNSKYIIRITSDCPLVDYRIINNMIVEFQKRKPDYYANTYPLPTKYPDGMDIEIFNFKTLEFTNRYAYLPSEREHVTPYMFKTKKFKILKKNLHIDLSDYRFCIDYKKDFILFKKFIDYFKNKIYNVSMFELVKYVKNNPKFIYYQKKIKRNEGWTSALKKDEKYK